MDPLKIYEYLVKSRNRVFDAVRPLTREQYHREFPIGLKTIAGTLTHVMICEWYYIERLEGRDVPPYAQWPIHDEKPPEKFEIIEAVWHEQAKKSRASIALQQDLDRTVTWLSFPDDTRGNKRFQITCNAGDMLTQLALHEIHHRAQVMAMLRELGSPVQDVDYNDLMYERVEARS
jgi:uncharacterized damage-inducible protein DinB